MLQSVPPGKCVLFQDEPFLPSEGVARTYLALLCFPVCERSQSKKPVQDPIDGSRPTVAPQTSNLGLLSTVLLRQTQYHPDISVTSEAPERIHAGPKELSPCAPLSSGIDCMREVTWIRTCASPDIKPWTQTGERDRRWTSSSKVLYVGWTSL